MEGECLFTYDINEFLLKKESLKNDSYISNGTDETSEINKSSAIMKLKICSYSEKSSIFCTIVHR